MVIISCFTYIFGTVSVVRIFFVTCGKTHETGFEEFARRTLRCIIQKPIMRHCASGQHIQGRPQ
jgi:hypothetical protein